MTLAVMFLCGGIGSEFVQAMLTVLSFFFFYPYPHSRQLQKNENNSSGERRKK